VFKGGNLLWYYIQTPRATIDLDFATRSPSNHASVQRVLHEACKRDEEVEFEVLEFRELDGAANALIRFRTDGTDNRFEVDIVYNLETVTQSISSPVRSDQQLTAARIENIIADKFSACARFGAGNTRMKDLDDLWRIAKSEQPIDRAILREIVQDRGIALELESRWINPLMQKAWDSHRKRYKDLPKDLEELFLDINSFWSV
jgi:hypothetical protein